MQLFALRRLFIAAGTDKRRSHFGQENWSKDGRLLLGSPSQNNIIHIRSFIIKQNLQETKPGKVILKILWKSVKRHDILGIKINNTFWGRKIHFKPSVCWSSPSWNVPLIYSTNHPKRVANALLKIIHYNTTIKWCQIQLDWKLKIKTN